MIWLLGASSVVIIALLLVVLLYARSILDELRDLGSDLHIPEKCKFHESEFRCNAIDQPCLYSPGSEPERICALREEEKRNKGEKTFVQPAPRWNDRSPPGEE